jgi:hypothetical protein
MSLFSRHLAFQPVDPLGDGLGDEIEAEQHEKEAIVLEEQLDGSLANSWEQILDDVKHDPDWFQFTEDE